MMPSMRRYIPEEKIQPRNGDCYGVWVTIGTEERLIFSSVFKSSARHQAREWKHHSFRARWGKLPATPPAPKEQGKLFDA